METRLSHSLGVEGVGILPCEVSPGGGADLTAAPQEELSNKETFWYCLKENPSSYQAAHEATPHHSPSLTLF